MNFSQRLKAIIKEERYSQRETADITGISLSSLEKYISGRQEAGVESVMKIVNHEQFKKYTLWLMTGEVAPDIGQVCPSFSTLERCGLVDEDSLQKKVSK